MKLVSKTKVRITVETDSVLFIRRRRNLVQAWCDKCCGLTEFASLEDASILIAAAANIVIQLIDEQKLHSLKAGDESLIVCLPSILDQRSRDQS